MNLETFNLTVVPTLEKKHKVTEKGFYMKFRLQSIYKTEFPFNNEYERYFVIEDNVYKLSDSAKIDVNQAFKQEFDCSDIVFRKNERTTFVNVPFERFILVNEQVTDNLIVVDKNRSNLVNENVLQAFDLEYNKKGELVEKNNKVYDLKGNEILNISKSTTISSMKENIEQVGMIYFQEDRTTEQYEQEQIEKWSKIDEKIAEQEQNERIMREAKNTVDNSLETTEDYYQFLQNRADNIVKTIILKDREYTESHWLENFEEACRIKGLEINCTNLLKILDGYRLKHQVSINKIQRDILKGKILNQDLINEKYGDYINFMLIEQAIILKYNHINKISF